MNIIHVIVLAIIEGLTEFLPVSSTGHMVVASALMGIGKDDFVKLFLFNGCKCDEVKMDDLKVEVWK